MTETVDPTNSPEGNGPRATPLDSDVARLVRLGGARPKMPDDRVERMSDELRPLWQEQVGSRRRPTLRWVAVAALVTVSVGTALLVRSLLDVGTVTFATVARVEGTVSGWSGQSAAPLAAGESLETGHSVATASGARVALDASTGHSLRLDENTRVVLVSTLELRLEQGAVYVDSHGTTATDDTRGLTVLTPFGRVEEIGTQFEVRLSADTLTVRVREGETRIDTPSAEHRGLAGEELTIRGGQVNRRSLQPHDPVFAWTQRISPAWPLDGSGLEAFLAWAAREGGLDLEYADEEIARQATEIVLSGEVEGLSPRQALDAVLPAVGLAHQIDGGTLSISRPEPSGRGTR